MSTLVAIRQSLLETMSVKTRSKFTFYYSYHCYNRVSFAVAKRRQTDLYPVSNPTFVQGENVNIGGNQTVVARDNVGGNQTNIETQVVINVGDGAESTGMWKFEGIQNTFCSMLYVNLLLKRYIFTN